LSVITRSYYPMDPLLRGLFQQHRPKQDIPLYMFMAGSLQIEELPTTSGF
jgi:hypothetical protein